MSLIRFILFSLAALSASSFANTSEHTLSELLDDIWQYRLSVSPVMATSRGVHQYDDQLTDMSPEALAERDKQYRAFLALLNAIDTDSLSRTSQINFMMQQRNLQNYIDNYRFNGHYVPITSESGFHSGMARVPNAIRIRNLKDVANYFSRLEQFPKVFEQQIYWMRKGIETGMVQPKVVLLGFEDAVASYYSVPAKDSSFYRPLKALEKLSISDDQKKTLSEEAETIINDKVFAAYKSFYDFLVKEYIPAAKDDIASSTWPEGIAYYQNRSVYYTTTDMTADEIHKVGLEEVARIRAEMQQVVDELKFEGDINAFIQYLRTDPKFYAKTAKELLMHAAYYSKLADAKLPKLFYKLPRTPYGVQPVPDSIAPKYTTGRYIGSSRSDEPGYYWVNTYALDKRPLYAIPALTLHEAVPGHHLQNALAAEMEDLPPVRRYTYISAFGEGWGLYSEFLGKEVGYYQDLYDEFGRLSYEMWRACRLVVDTGMHIKGWSRQKAMDYMLENTALSEHNVRTEIDRYISWPAQALSYKIGEIEIKRLRKEAEQALGNKFDLRAFHDAVLEHGSVPLSVLRENIQLHITQQASK